MNIVENFGLIKDRVKTIGEEACAKGFLTDIEKKEILFGLDKEQITIGVIGQMKNGKSTFLNAYLFNKKYLPTSSTPMTASLSFLQYGKEETLEVEFYDEEEFKKIKDIAEEQPSEENEDVLKGCKDLMERARKIEDELPNLLGRTKRVPFNKINDYIGSDGKYVPITKAFIIKAPSQKLKEVNIVDTPGFNDPVPSREQRAINFLEKADIILILLVANRPLDKTDREIIFNRIPLAGTVKLVVMLNKYDLLFHEKAESEVIDYIEEEWGKERTKTEKENEAMFDIFYNCQPFPCSTHLALLGRMSMEDIEKDVREKEYFEKYQKDFPHLDTQEKFVEFSRIKEIEEEISKIIKEDKLKIIVKKPLNAIKAKISEKKYSIENLITEKEQEMEDFGKFEKKVNEVIEDKLIEAEEKSKKLKNQIKRRLKQIRDNLLNDIGEKFPSKGLFESARDYQSKCRIIATSCIRKYIRNAEADFSEYQNEMYDILKVSVDDIDVKIDELVGQHIPYSSEIVSTLKNRFLNILDETIELEGINIEVNFDTTDIDSAIFFWMGTSKEILIEEAYDSIENYLPEEKAFEPLDRLSQQLQANYSYIREKFADKVISPIRDGYENAKRNRDKKKRRLEELPKEIDKLHKDMKHFEKELISLEAERNKLLDGVV